MPTYTAPARDARFILNEVLELASYGNLPGFESATPDIIDTVVGEGGHQLTDAQAQQIALARLVLVDPPIAVLDEATAEAGSLGARDLERSAAAATAGRTTLVVAHRLNQAMQCDEVVVLDRVSGRAGI